MRRKDLPRFFKAALASCIVLGVAGACGIPEEKHNAVLDELKETQAKLRQESARLQQTEDELGQVRSELDETKDLLEGLRAKLQRLMREKAELESTIATSEEELAKLRERSEELEKKTAEFRQLEAALKSQIEAGKIELLGNRIRMKDKILFSSGSTKINKEGKEALKEIAKVFKTLGRKKIFQITGHTDNVPTGKGFKDNWELSTARAVRVVRFLGKAGVDANLLAAAGFSEYRPVCPANDTKECKSQNRRIDIILMPNIEFSAD